MSADQLIAKALSTTSEEEAIACLVMARKKGLKLGSSGSSQGGHTVESRTAELRNMIEKYNNLAEKYNFDINYHSQKASSLKKQLAGLEKRVGWTRKTAVIAVILSIILTATVTNSIANSRIKALQAEINQMELAPCQTIFCVIGRGL
jgi:hypothetical protein